MGDDLFSDTMMLANRVCGERKDKKEGSRVVYGCYQIKSQQSKDFILL